MQALLRVWSRLLFWRCDCPNCLAERMGVRGVSIKALADGTIQLGLANDAGPIVGVMLSPAMARDLAASLKGASALAGAVASFARN